MLSSRIKHKFNVGMKVIRLLKETRNPTSYGIVRLLRKPSRFVKKQTRTVRDVLKPSFQSWVSIHICFSFDKLKVDNTDRIIASCKHIYTFHAHTYLLFIIVCQYSQRSRNMYTHNNMRSNHESSGIHTYFVYGGSHGSKNSFPSFRTAPRRRTNQEVYYQQA